MARPPARESICGHPALERVGLGALLTCVVLVLASPVGAGAGARRTLVAPYARTVASPAGSLTSVCGKVTEPQPAQWNPKTGSLLVAESGRSSACDRASGAVPHVPDMYVGSDVLVGVPFSGVGNRNVTVKWSWQETTTGRIGTVFRCTFVPVPPNESYNYQDCIWDVAWGISLSAYLYDLTNGTQVSQDSASWSIGNSVTGYNESDYSVNSTGVATYSNASATTLCANSSAHSPSQDTINSCVGPGTLSGKSTLWLDTRSPTYSDPLVRGHRYQVVLEFSSFVSIYWFGQGFGYPTSVPAKLTAKGASNLSVNVATGGNGATVTGITL